MERTSVMSVFLRLTDFEMLLVSIFVSNSLRLNLGADGNGFKSGFALLLFLDLSEVARRARSSLCSSTFYWYFYYYSLNLRSSSSLSFYLYGIAYFESINAFCISR